MCLDNVSYSHCVLNNASYKVSIENVSHVYLDWIRLNRYIYIYVICVRLRLCWRLRRVYYTAYEMSLIKLIGREVTQLNIGNLDIFQVIDSYENETMKAKVRTL